MENNTDQKQAALANLEVLKKIGEILSAYEPVANLSMGKAIAKLVNESQTFAENEACEELNAALEEHEDLLENIPACQCPECLKEAGFDALTPGHTQYLTFLRVIQLIIKEVNERGVENVRGAVVSMDIRDTDEHEITISMLSAVNQNVTERLIGTATVDYLIEMEDYDFDDETKMMILEVAVATAKKGTKWRNFQAKKRLESIIREGGKGLRTPSDITEMLRNLSKAGGDPMIPGLFEIKGKTIDEVKENFINVLNRLNPEKSED